MQVSLCDKSVAGKTALTLEHRLDSRRLRSNNDAPFSPLEVVMRILCFVVLLGLCGSASSQTEVQAPPKPPQTPRQALIEMFLGKTPGAFAKHLPRATAQALTSKGETEQTSIIHRLAGIGQGLTASNHIETFDEGPTLLTTEEDEGKVKVKTEVGVEYDSFSGDSDEIKVSIHMYRDGQPQFLGVIPFLIFSLKQEDDVWKLTEATAEVHAPLTDPDYLKGIRKRVNENNEMMASVRVGFIGAADVQYAAKHPDRGYTCSLTDLFPKESQAGAAGQAPNDSPSPDAIDQSPGYNLALSGCEGAPVTKFQITATPADSDAGMKAFCADQSGTVRSEANGNGSDCLSQGTPVNKADDGPPAGSVD